MRARQSSLHWYLTWLLVVAFGACSASKGKAGDAGDAGQDQTGDQVGDVAADRSSDAAQDQVGDAADDRSDASDDRSPDAAQDQVGDASVDRSSDAAQDQVGDAADDRASDASDGRSSDVAQDQMVDQTNDQMGDRSGDAGDDCLIDAGAGGGSLVTNGSFEQPLVPVGGYMLFTNGENISGWTVTGATGNVAPFSTALVSDGFSFQAQDGQQSIDLTGVSQTATGVSQTVATTPGRAYCLSFWVGNVFSPAGGYGADSTVNVLVDGQLVTSATNRQGQGSTILSWQRFSTTVHATGPSTSIAFVNGDPSSDNSNFLDNVVMR